MRKIKNAKKKKKEVIILSDSDMNKVMKLLEEICNDEDKFKLISFLITSPEYFDKDFYLFTFKQALFELYFTTDRTLKFNNRKNIENGISIILNNYKPLLVANIDLTMAIILFDINDVLTKYANIPNKILMDLSKARTEKAQQFINCLIKLDRGFKTSMSEFLGEEPYLNDKFKAKFIEVTNWITNAFYNRINSKNINDFFSYDFLNENLIEKVKKITPELNKMLSYSTWAFKNFKNFCYLINSLTARTSLIELGFDDLKESGIDKKELTHLKSTITRTNNLIETLYNLLNYGEDNPNDETIDEYRDFYGFLTIVDLEKISKLEKLIA